MKKRYTNEKIIKAIKNHEVGAKVEDIWVSQMALSTSTVNCGSAELAQTEKSRA